MTIYWALILQKTEAQSPEADHKDGETVLGISCLQRSGNRARRVVALGVVGSKEGF